MDPLKLHMLSMADPIRAVRIRLAAAEADRLKKLMEPLLSISNSELTEIEKGDESNFDKREIIVVNAEEKKSIWAYDPKRTTHDFPTGRRYFVKTTSYNSWKALEPSREKAHLDYLMDSFTAHLGNPLEYKYFDPSNFYKLVEAGLIKKDDYLETTETLYSQYEMRPFTSYRLKAPAKGGSRKRRRRERKTKHRKTKRRYR